MRRRRESPDYFAALLWSAFLAGVSALVFLVVSDVSLSETERESEGSLLALFLLGFVSPMPWIATLLFAGPGVLIAYGLWLLLLRHRSLERCAALVFAVVCAAILATTPWLRYEAILVSYGALLVGAIVARAMPWTLTEEDRVERALRREAPAA